MSTRRRRRAPPAFVRWLQLLFATAFAWKRRPFRANLARRLRRIPARPRAAPRRGGRIDDFAPTQVMKRIDDIVDERSIYAGAGVDVSEEDLETLPAELREAFLGARHRARGRGETATTA